MSCLYIVELGNGRIKVGQSVNPQTRVATHRAMARAHGLTPGREWTSQTGKGPHEQSLTKFCEPRATECHGEYFAGVPFDVAVAYAKHLPNKTAALGAVAALEASAAVVARFTPAAPDDESTCKTSTDLGGRVAELRALLASYAAPTASGVGRLAVSSADVAELLAIPESVIDDAISSGQLPVLRLGRRTVRIPVAALDEFFARLAPAEEAAAS